MMMDENQEYAGDPYEDDEESGNGAAKEGADAEPAANPINVQQYLESVSYPATKQDLLDSASKNAAPDEVMTALENIEDAEYGSPAEVSARVGKEGA